MLLPARAFLLALRRLAERQPEMRQRLRIHFLGTNYDPSHKADKRIEPLALEYGVSDMVVEQPSRMPYFSALRCLYDADALIVLGSDEVGYSPSKIYSNILMRKPILAIVHEDGDVAEVFRQTRAGTLVGFCARQDAEAISEAIYREWFERWPLPTPQTNWPAFEPYTAQMMAGRLCEVFDRVVTKDPSPSEHAMR